MAYSYKTQSNLGKGKTEYSRYYGGFRGVDFSNDHTQVNQSRLAYLVNMYKDYQSGQGEALETIVGFRQRANFTITPIVSSSGVCSSTPVTQTNKEVFGIFFFKCKENGEVVNKVLIHCGNKLFLWRDYPNTVNIPTSSTITMPEPTSTTVVGETAIKTFNLTLDFPCTPRHNGKVERSHRSDSESFYKNLSFTSFEDLKEQMAAWNNRYNNRPHSSLRNRDGKRVWFSPIQKREELIEDLKADRLNYKVRFLKKKSA